MFNNCHKLKEIKGINNFDTTNTTNMKGMFNNCNELENLDITNFDTSNVINMDNMLNNCHKINKKNDINDLINSNNNQSNSIYEEEDKEIIMPSNEEENQNLKESCESSDLDDNLFAVIFTSTDQSINYPIICRNTDTFSNLEEKLFDEYHELKRKNIYFLCNGNIINRTASIKENKIKKGNIILIKID